MQLIDSYMVPYGCLSRALVGSRLVLGPSIFNASIRIHLAFRINVCFDLPEGFGVSGQLSLDDLDG